MKPQNNHEYERVETNHGVFYVCLDCGAVGVKVGERMVIQHYKNCNPGESKKWESYYNEAAKEEEENPNADEKYKKYLEDNSR